MLAKMTFRNGGRVPFDPPPHSAQGHLSGDYALGMVEKHRNTIIFDKACPSIAGLMDTIQSEARSWAKAGGKGDWSPCWCSLPVHSLDVWRCMVGCRTIFGLGYNLLFLSMYRETKLLCFLERKNNTRYICLTN